MELNDEYNAAAVILDPKESNTFFTIEKNVIERLNGFRSWKKIKQLSSLSERVTSQLKETIISYENKLPNWMTCERMLYIRRIHPRPEELIIINLYLAYPYCGNYCWTWWTKLGMAPWEGRENVTRWTKRLSEGNYKWKINNLSKTWSFSREVYKIVPDSSKKECLAMLELAKKITNLISDSMLGLTSSNESFCDVNIQRVLFQVGSLSPLFFFLCMIALTLILRKV